MNRKLGYALAFLLIAALVVPLSCGKAAGPAPAPTTPPHPQVKVFELTSPAGAGYFEAQLAIDTVLAKTHPWLRKESQETQGYVYNLKVMIDQADRRKTTIADSCPVSIWMAGQKKEPFTEGLKGYDPKVLTNLIWPTWGLVTINPNIKTYADLKGKRIAYGATAGTATVMSEDMARCEGLFDICGPVEHVTFGKIPSMLLDGLVDAGLVAFMMNGKTGELQIGSPLQELIASGKKPRLIPYDKAAVDKAKAGGNPGVPVEIPKGTLPDQDKPALFVANPCMMGVDAKEFPEDVAYEITKWFIANVDGVKATGGYNSLYTRDFLPYAWKTEQFHPGALKAFKEAGLLK